MGFSANIFYTKIDFVLTSNFNSLQLYRTLRLEVRGSVQITIDLVNILERVIEFIKFIKFKIFKLVSKYHFGQVEENLLNRESSVFTGSL